MNFSNKNYCCLHLFSSYNFVIKIVFELKYLKYYAYSRKSHFGSIQNMNTHSCGYSKYEYFFMRHRVQTYGKYLVIEPALEFLHSKAVIPITHHGQCESNLIFGHSVLGSNYCSTLRSTKRDYNLFKLRKKLEMIISIHIRIRVSQHRCSPVRRFLF